MDQKKSFPEFYITTPQPCPYIPGRIERKLFTHLSPDKAPGIVDNLLKGGFRRSQNIAYMPYCETCAACVSVRVMVNEFERRGTFERVWRRNQDIVATHVAARPTSEQYALFRDYIDARHADGGMADMSVRDFALMVQDSIIDTFITEYRIRPAPEANLKASDWPLVGVALSDRLGDGISMVYSFYDPERSDRSLGTYMILETITQAARLGLPFVYLGYWIDGSRKMAYKTKFKPQERLTSKGWSRVGP